LRLGANAFQTFGHVRLAVETKVVDGRRRLIFKQRIKNMNKPLSIALLAAGIVLIIFGINATHAFTSEVSRFFSGSPTNKAIWMLIGGIVATILGLFGLMRPLKW
jgi:uncharacterized membrane protein HdeD (DUF308 family)